MSPIPPSNSVRIWMPIFIGDYMADTIGLSLAEHGAYFLSMMFYWRKGESITTSELRAICGKEFDRVSQFYVICDGRWHHKRIDIELAKALYNINKMKNLSMKAVSARREKGQLPPEPHG